MIAQFLEQFKGCEVRCTGQSFPKDHGQSCGEAWSCIPQEMWVHKFINNIDTTLINWYLEAELRLTTTNWQGMTQKFIATFLFEIQYPVVDPDLHVIRKKVFEEAPSLPAEKEEDEWTIPL
jgi:hypothetical protein